MLPVILKLEMYSLSKEIERLTIELGRMPLRGLPIKPMTLIFLQFFKEERKLHSKVEDVK